MQVVVTQPYVPAYRVPLFDAVARELEADGISFAVAAGSPGGAQAARADQAVAPWAHEIRHRTVSVKGRDVGVRRLPEELESPDLLVTELDIKNELGWSRRAHGASRVVLWGHGRPYVVANRRAVESAKRLMVRRVDHAMTYTEGGRDYLVDELHQDPDHVTAIGNAVDVSDLLAGRARGLEDEVARHVSEAWGTGPHLLYVGGLDRPKRIDFMLDAAEALHAQEPRTSLLVVGDGEMRPEVEERAGDGGAVGYLGRIDRTSIGAVATMCGAIWMPGRVGLVAVDALALELPVHTTEFPFHAPELEFLKGDSVKFLPDDPADFADAALASLREHPDGVGAVEPPPTIETVASNFARVVREVLAGRP
ncbi:glycosyltransferase [Demequina sp. SYSU T00192]|uniref:D-inositol 3-phosphate glycosyltransferase n=1 Tax=Demequina litoralis TaxID=3051660 RepID=A0ABT8G8D4_9MICO|nr:glycosyltransferase [Demequina sp. SYSU T00192]MDN4475408.1 glycosyltransferase [Demequina sp. SYSU T00192]